MPRLLNEDQKKVLDKVINEENAPKINDAYRKSVTEDLIINQMDFLAESADQANVTGAGIANWDPVLIKMVRRSAPTLMAFDLTGVQPMNGPVGQIFAMRARYTSQTGTEALHNEADTDFSGTGAHVGDTSGFATDAFAVGDPAVGTGTGTSMSTAAGEGLGTTSGGNFAEMAFSIEKTSVTAGTRALKAEFSREIQHDLKQIHNLSAEDELGNILATEVRAEQDRELLRTVNISAVIGAAGTTTAGRYDLDADNDGRWLVEKWKSLVFQIEKEANQVGIETRRGRANRIVCSANVASGLAMAGILDHAPRYEVALNVDPTSQSYAGVLLGKYPVFIDPYATVDYITVAYRGPTAWDAGVYYCPYVPFEMMRAVGEDSFQPKIGLKTRYGIVANPFAANTAAGAKTGKGLGQGENPYYRKFQVTSV